MDDPRIQQFFLDPTQSQQRQYEALRAVVIDKQPLQAAAERFGFSYGTLRNYLSSFRRQIQNGNTPPFSSLPHVDALSAPLPTHRSLVPKHL